MSRIKTLARPRASALRAWLFVLPLMALIVAAWPAKAADIDELEDQIARIQRQMQDLQEEVYRNGGGAPGSSGGAYDASTNQRLNDMEQSLRTLTGQVEQLAFEVRSLREQMERGVFDIEAVKHANESLIATIQDSLQIADAGKAKRAAAEEELRKMEAELRDSLASARARAQPVAQS